MIRFAAWTIENPSSCSRRPQSRWKFSGDRDERSMQGSCVRPRILPEVARTVQFATLARMSALSLPLAGESPDPPLYEGDIEADMRTMNRKRAEELGGRLSFPSKMDVAAWGIPATRCRIGSALAQVGGSTCESCYALKGTFRFKGVKDVLEENYRKLQNALWTPAIAAQIRWLGEERFRWFLSGDVQGVSHLRNIIRVCLATP